jgi:hypothetical protein
MKLLDLQKKLIAVARANPPSDHVPFAFEKRVMALIKAQAMDHWAVWARTLWLAAAPCVAVMLFFTAWAHFQSGANNSDSSPQFAQQFDNTLFAAVDQNNDSSW